MGYGYANSLNNANSNSNLLGNSAYNNFTNAYNSGSASNAGAFTGDAFKLG